MNARTLVKAFLICPCFSHLFSKIRIIRLYVVASAFSMLFYRGADLPIRSRIRELKQQTFFRRRRQPDVNFTSVSRFPPTWSAVATRRRLCFAYFDVACKTRGLRCYFRVFMSFCTDIFARIRCLRYYSIILDVVLAVS